jgi:glycosyltransferase involved in cell wall biosynthesis
VTTPPIRVLELRSVRGTGGGPEKTILQGAALSDPARYAITVCYIRDKRDEVFSIDARAAALGVDYVEVLERHSFDPGIWQPLRRLVRDRRIDIVHAHDYKTNLLAWLLGRAENVQPLTTLHGYTGHSWRERIYYAADKRLVARFPRAIAVSGELRQDVVAVGGRPERIVTVLNGIDDRAFRRDRTAEPAARAELGLRPGQVVIGSVGRLERQKRFDLLMETFASLRAARPGVELKLVIAGDGSLKQDLIDLRRRLGLDEHCVLPGLIADVARLHHAFDLFVQSSDYEGTPNAVLEAMAMETPLVATDVGGTVELVRHGVDGLIVPPNSERDLRAAIERLLQEPEARRRFADSARLRVEHDLSFRTRMRTVEGVYDSLVARRSQPRPEAYAQVSR